MHLGAQQWVLVGWSWGTTLALAYAQAHPDRVNGLVLTAVTTTSPSDVAWITRDVGRLFPAEWARFRDGVPEEQRSGSLVEQYALLLASPDPHTRDQAARDWCDWEESHVNLGPEPRPIPRYDDPHYRMCFARLITHYWRHAAWRAEGELLDGVKRINHLPAVLIHGRLDLSGPPDVAWTLAQSWPGTQLHIVPGAGHSPEGTVSDHVVEALDQLAILNTDNRDSQ